MALHQNFSNLLETKKTESTLKKDAKGAPVKTLQQMLYQMGFGEELKWDKYGADGDYGGATTAAVQAFAAKNGLESDGLTVSQEVGSMILQRFLLLETIKQLNLALEEDKLTEIFPPDGNEKYPLAPLLEALGATGDDETQAMKAFAGQHEIPYDGQNFPAPLAEKLLAEISRFYGDGLSAFKPATHPPSEEESAGTSPGPEAFSTTSGLEIHSREHLKKGKKVTSHTVRFKELEVEFYGFGKFGGFFNYGGRKPSEFIENHWGEYFNDSGLSQSARKAILAVSLNEGNLDAINAWDRAFLSFGMFQWTLGTGDGNGELPALLLKVKTQEPEAFQQYFGQFGIDVDEQRTGTTYGFISLGGKTVHTRAQKEQFRSPEWGFRFWHAGQDPRIQAVEIGHALSRLNNFYWKEKDKLRGFTLAQLINSEYGVALLIDQNVNRGVDVFFTVGDVLDGFDLDNVDNWSDEEEQRLLEKYLERRVRTHMHDPQLRAGRIREMAGEGDNQLSMRRKTFHLLKNRTKSIFSAETVPAPPEGYREADYPDIIVQELADEERPD
ncbi:MAG: peptidoglycan-binding protein [Phaeodactylibacter sp.]|nr:peptidoglycan-binding protein [Phaeodactylibacter sp.]